MMHQASCIMHHAFIMHATALATGGQRDETWSSSRPAAREVVEVVEVLLQALVEEEQELLLLVVAPRVQNWEEKKTATYPHWNRKGTWLGSNPA
jgi:hypothetical protein